MGAWLYILQCADGSYYTGTTRADLETRVAEHQAGKFDGFTSNRRPVEPVHSEYFDRIVDAIAAERQIKGWSRAKKEALIAGDFARIRQLSKRRTPPDPHGLRRVACATLLTMRAWNYKKLIGSTSTMSCTLPFGLGARASQSRR